MRPTLCAPGEGAAGGPGGSSSRLAADEEPGIPESKRLGQITVGLVLAGRLRLCWLVVGWFICLGFACLVLKIDQLFLNSAVTPEFFPVSPYAQAGTGPRRHSQAATAGAPGRASSRLRTHRRARRREAAGNAWAGRPSGKGRAGLPGGAGWSATPGQAGLLPAPSFCLRDAPRSLT